VSNKILLLDDVHVVFQ